MAARQYRRSEDEAIRPTPDDDPAAGLEGVPRMDMTVLEAMVPAVVDAAVTGPLVLTRGGREMFVVLPLDAYHRLWAAQPRPPMIEGEVG